MKNITLKVEGMSCQHCVHAIESALRQIGADGKVDLNLNSVEVNFNEDTTTIEQIKDAIEEQGYDVV